MTRLPTTLQSGPVRVLLVEDDRDHSALIRRLLRGDGVSFVTSESSTLASTLEVLCDATFDVVLLDLNLPDSRGEETLEAVLAAAPRTAVLVLTSLDDVQLATRAVSLGAQDYLIKLQLEHETLLTAMRYARMRKQQILELQETNDSLKAFSHTVAHEVRSPAAVAIMAIDALQQEGLIHSGPIATEFVHMARGALENLTELVHDLLAFAEVETGAGEMTDVDLGAVIGQLRQQFDAELRECGGTLVVGSLPVVRGSAAQLTVLLSNLIGNAIKYRGRDPLHITIDAVSPETDSPSESAEIVGPAAHIQIADNGRGIGEAHLAKLFDVFYRADPPDEVAGTGIGLSLCKRIAQRHDGSIAVESREGEGTTFRLTLPLAAGGDEPGAIDASASLATTASAI